MTSIKLRTPRDVRTIHRATSGGFLAVDDGPFYGGEVRATAHTRDGRSVTRTPPVAPGS